jgi:hypothetical protein
MTVKHGNLVYHDERCRGNELSEATSTSDVAHGIIVNVYGHLELRMKCFAAA